MAFSKHDPIGSFVCLFYRKIYRYLRGLVVMPAPALFVAPSVMPRKRHDTSPRIFPLRLAMLGTSPARVRGYKEWI